MKNSLASQFSRPASQLFSVLFAIIACTLFLTQLGLATAAEREPVREWFEPAAGCPGWDEHITDDGVVQLVWMVGEGGTLAADQRAESLGAEPCTKWQEASLFEAGDNLSSENFSRQVSADLELEVELVGESSPTALDIRVNITPLEELQASVNLRLLVTVDHSEGEGLDSHFVVKHYHWSSSFYRGEGNLTEWNYTIDSSRFSEDGIPFTSDEIWRLNVVVLLVDDLNNSILAATKTGISTPSSVPPTGQSMPAILLGIGLLVGFVVIVLGERNREEGLPHISGGLHRLKGEWKAIVQVRAGKHDMVLKGAHADAPWRIVKPPRGQRLAAGEEKTFEVRLRYSKKAATSDGSSEQKSLPEAMTRWEVDVEELGGWVLDLRLPPRSQS
jgi:hypothetical protein